MAALHALIDIFMNKYCKNSRIKLRRLIRNSAILYPQYVKYVLRNKTATFPSKEVDLHLTGFPRSANTYCLNIVKVALPQLKLSTHIHTTASLRLAIRYTTPTVVLVRDPVSTVCSLLIMHSKRSANAVESLLKDYIEYYDFVAAQEAFKILKFEDVVSSPVYIIRVVSEFLQIEMDNELIAKKAEEGQNLVESKEAQKPTMRSSLPNEARRKMKLELEEGVRKHPLCDHAVELYQQLVSK